MKGNHRRIRAICRSGRIWKIRAKRIWRKIAARLEREIPAARPVHFPVNAVLAGRRNNPPDPEIGLPPLAVYSPIHYQELPELFMEFISSLTGKSPSTTGFGSEGALTKGPFNALWPVVDLNNALVSAILTGYAGFTTSAGYVGPQVRVDHDISMLVPEIWCRMRVHERDPQIPDCGRVAGKGRGFRSRGPHGTGEPAGLSHHTAVCRPFPGPAVRNAGCGVSEEMLRPEKQDAAMFAAGVDAIVEAQRRVALNYFEDGSVDAACPPLKALLHIMAHGNYDGMGVEHPEVRAMFAREALLASDWYGERLRVKQQRDIALWLRHVRALEQFAAAQVEFAVVDGLDLDARALLAREQLGRVSGAAYLDELVGTIGADPFYGQIS